jgi:hypothetical protein
MGDVNVDTIACRLKFLEDANFNAATSCRYAGASGGGRCGSLVTNVCRVATHVCDGKAEASYATQALCLDATNGLVSMAAHWGSKQGVAAADDNSLECRAYHAIASLTAGNVHCGHFGAAITGTGASPCKGLVAPDPIHYCDLLEFNCNTPATQQYTDKAQCLSAVGKLPTSVTDTAQAFNANNSLGCRVYHAQAANVLTVDHCGHAGPSGGGVCGSELQAWGSILKNTCNDPSVENLVRDVSPTIINAAFPPGFRPTSNPANTSEAKYTSVYDQAGNTQSCRIYHLGVAASAPSHCVHGDLSGANNCGANMVDNLCLFIEKTCNFGSAPWQFANAAACKTGLTNSSTNVIQVGGAYPDGAANSYTCRFYHTYVAATYLAGGAAAATPNASSFKEQHCGHVLQVPLGAGGCGTPAAGVTGAPTASPKPSAASASTLSVLGAISAVVVGFFLL